LRDHSRWPIAVKTAAVVGFLLLQGLTLLQLRTTRAEIERLARAAAQSGEPRDAVAIRWEQRPGDALSADELRAILRQELQPVREAQRADVAAEKDSPAAEAARLPGNAEAFQEAQHVVADALRVGVWGEHQAKALRDVRGKLTTEQLVALSRDLFPAVNEHRVRLEVRGPLF